MEIPETHPLQQLFRELVGRHYAEEIGIRDPQVDVYKRQALTRPTGKTGSRRIPIACAPGRSRTVSYTHLDVYKRQLQDQDGRTY